MPLAAKHVASFVPLLLFFLFAGSASNADAAVFRDRAAFEAAAQNLRKIDFEGMRPGDLPFEATIDGLKFVNYLGPTTVAPRPGSNNTILYAGGAGEITVLTIYLPPGTTAVGCDQFSRPMDVLTSSGEKVSMTPSDASNFVGFVSDTPIASLSITLDFPEPTPAVELDNLSYGQRRAGNEPPAPLLLTDSLTGRAAAFDATVLTQEPFDVNTTPTRNLSADVRTRVTLLVVGLSFNPASDVPFVTARAVDSQHRVFDLPVEAVGGVKNLSWLAQVTVRLPPGISGAGDVSVSVTVRGVESNNVTLRVN